MRTSALLLALAAAAAFASPPNAEQMAKLQYDVKKATDAVDKKYEGRQLSSEERKQQMKDRAAAENAVLEKAGVEKKEYVKADAKMSKEDRATVQAETEKLGKQEKAAAGQAQQGGSKEVVIEKGGKGELTPEQEAAEMDKAMGLGKGGGGKRKR